MYSVPGVVICLAISFIFRLDFFSCTAFQGLLSVQLLALVTVWTSFHVQRSRGCYLFSYQLQLPSGLLFMYSVPGVVICLAISFSSRLDFFSCTAFQGLLSVQLLALVTVWTSFHVQRSRGCYLFSYQLQLPSGLLFMYSVPGVVICLAISFSYRLDFFSCTAFQGLLSVQLLALVPVQNSFHVQRSRGCYLFNYQLQFPSGLLFMYSVPGVVICLTISFSSRLDFFSCTAFQRLLSVQLLALVPVQNSFHVQRSRGLYLFNYQLQFPSGLLFMYSVPGVVICLTISFSSRLDFFSCTAFQGLLSVQLLALVPVQNSFHVQRSRGCYLFNYQLQFPSGLLFMYSVPGVVICLTISFSSRLDFFSCTAFQRLLSVQLLALVPVQNSFHVQRSRGLYLFNYQLQFPSGLLFMYSVPEVVICLAISFSSRLEFFSCTAFQGSLSV